MSLKFLHKDREAIRMPMVHVRKTASTLFDQSYRHHTICNLSQGRIQDFPRGGLNIEVISEARDLGGAAPQKL